MSASNPRVTPRGALPSRLPDALPAARTVALAPDARPALIVVWLVVNAVNLLQAVGFATRPFAPWVNPVLGVVITALVIPATWALVRLVRTGAAPRLLAGPLVFALFVAFHVLVEYVFQVEWRDPPVPAIQAPYLVLFFGAIFLMGAPMFRVNRRRWALTAVTTALLLGAMLYATWMGVG